MAEFRFDESANTIYQFVWASFCDWYLELIKPSFASGEGADECRTVAGWVLDQILVMLPPFMPFITEERWNALADPAHPRGNDLILAHRSEERRDEKEGVSTSEYRWAQDN